LSVCLSVTVVSSIRKAEQIEMPCGLRISVYQRAMTQMGSPHMRRNNFEGGGRGGHCELLGRSAVSCAKTAEAIEKRSRCRLGFGLRVEAHLLGVVHTGATWLIPLNRTCAAATWQ